MSKIRKQNGKKIQQEENCKKRPVKGLQETQGGITAKNKRGITARDMFTKKDTKLNVDMGPNLIHNISYDIVDQ